MTDIPAIPSPPVAIPEGFRLVANEIRRTKAARVLDCGCRLSAGSPYHRVVTFAYGQMIVQAGHIYGCLRRSPVSHH